MKKRENLTMNKRIIIVPFILLSLASCGEKKNEYTLNYQNSTGGGL